ncbi:MAG: hypothetical protein KIS85_05630 [Anaerolineales bacterium]|nr:hypothetical protein [Anaerolineales bacterium]
MKKLLLVALCGMLLLAACSGNQANPEEVAAIVAATLQAQQTADALAQPAGTTGRVEGAVCFPSPGIPAMDLYLSTVGTLDLPLSFAIAENQTAYSVEVPEGTYLAYAWLPDLTLAGAYTRAVACGLTADCTDHALVQFHVPAGETVSGINICDWYTEPGEIPGPTGDYFVPEGSQGGGTTGSGSTGSGTFSAGPTTGTITGTLSFPSSFMPSQTVVAFDMNSDTFYYVITSAGSSTYQISGLPPSTYAVIAYVTGENNAGGYTNFVPCGLHVDCPSHALIPVLVNEGDFVDMVDPQDWYAPEGTFPPNPVP